MVHRHEVELLAKRLINKRLAQVLEKLAENFRDRGIEPIEIVLELENMVGLIEHDGFDWPEGS